MSNENRFIILAIESAIAGGSIALLSAGGIPLESRIGPTDSGKTEHVLAAIDDCLRSSGLTPSSLNSLVVSAGPGSFTGIRAGVATALGLSLGLSRPLITVDVFDALQYVHCPGNKSLTFLPLGREKVVAGYCDADPENEQSPKRAILNISALDEFIRDQGPATSMLYHESLRSYFVGLGNAVNIGENIALVLGLYSLRPDHRSTEPYFLGRAPN